MTPLPCEDNKAVAVRRAADRRGDAGAYRQTRFLSAESTRAPVLARHHVARTLQQWSLDTELIADACLIVAEQAANAVQHSTGRTMLLIVTLSRGRVVLTVVDGGRWAGPLRVAQADDDAESGRGLALIDALADEWESYPLHGCTAVSAALRTAGRRAC